MPNNTVRQYISTETPKSQNAFKKYELIGAGMILVLPGINMYQCHSTEL